MASTPARMVLAVVVTCTASAAALTFTYEVTKDRIAEQERLAREKALNEALPEATEFTEMDENMLVSARESAGETRVDAIFDAGGAGWGVLVAPRGYGGPMPMVVGVDSDGKVTGVMIITQNETPGLGTKIVTDESFLPQFRGWDASDVDTAVKAFDAISGATKSSGGVRKGVVAAGHIYEEVLSQTEGGSVP
ncbi:MAG: FMN-binding protein [Coriobacteriia bacterium]|nr:FMN-binding protein [Coriobacteriia bacterium]